MEELNKILENHKHWIKRDIDGWSNMRADFSGADLHGVELRGANLKGAIFVNADLHGANLSDSNLCYANLANANLNRSYLSHANLYSAHLQSASLIEANLFGSNLHLADLGYANLIGATLDSANLIGVNLNKTESVSTYCRGKMLSEKIIGYKKCMNNVIVTLEIPRGAIVFSINGTKYRTNKAKVISIDGADRAISSYNGMSYYVGDEFTIYNFCCEYNKECGEGIHFFMTKDDAIDYEL